MLMLRLIKGPASVGTTYNLENGGSYIVGRAESADIQLKSSSVSKNHCRISVLPGNRVEIEDLGSSNGTFVNGLLIKRHVIKPGDTLNVHQFTFKLLMKAPEIVSDTPSGPRSSMGAFDGNAALDMNAAPLGAALNLGADPGPQNLGEKVEQWISQNIYPSADSLSSKFDLRYLITTFFLLWSVMIILFTAYPFMNEANNRVDRQAMEVGALYARQLVRINSQAVMDQRFRDLISDLDAVRGQTKNLISAYIIDAQKQQILAPASRLGQSLANPAIQKAIEAFSNTSNPNAEFTTKGDDGVGYAAAPIMVGTSEGNRTVAISFVMVATGEQKFSIAALFDQVVSSLLYSMIASILFLILVYRWMDGSISRMSDRVDYAMKKNEAALSSPVIWPAMAQLSEQISFALSKANTPNNSPSVGADSTGIDWAVATANIDVMPGMTFDANMIIHAWNSKMEMLTEVGPSSTIGQEFSRAWRDADLEEAVKSMATEAQQQPWVNVSRDFSINGNSLTLNVIFGSGAYLLLISSGGTH